MDEFLYQFCYIAAMKTTERDISRFIDDGGWVAERQKYALSDAQLHDLVALLGVNDEQTQSLAIYLQHIFQYFCVSCERYFARKEQYGKKVTTALREKKNVIEPLIHQLSEALDDLDKTEVKWLFSSPFDAMVNPRGLVKQMQDGLMAMEYLLENNEIEVTRSDNNLLLRNTLIALAELLEDKVGIICRRHYDNVEEVGHS